MCSHTEGPYHDCAYVNARNSLLEKAAKAANAVVPAYREGWGVPYVAWAERWDEEFLKAMDRLYKAGAHFEPSDPHDGDN